MGTNFQVRGDMRTIILAAAAALFAAPAWAVTLDVSGTCVQFNEFEPDDGTCAAFGMAEGEAYSGMITLDLPTAPGVFDSASAIKAFRFHSTAFDLSNLNAGVLLEDNQGGIGEAGQFTIGFSFINDRHFGTAFFSDFSGQITGEMQIGIHCTVLGITCPNDPNDITEHYSNFARMEVATPVPLPPALPMALAGMAALVGLRRLRTR
jgi:hypothetical protein